MCGRTAKHLGGDTDIPLDLYGKIIDDAEEMGVEMIILHSWGEPLLHPKIVEMIQYATAHGIRTWMSTNATLLDEEMSLRILASGLGALVFSVDGATAETYEAIRRGAKYETTVANIRGFLDLKKKQKVKMLTTVQMIEMPSTRQEIGDFIRMWSSYDVNVLVKPMIDWYTTEEDPRRASGFVCDKPWFWMKVQSSGLVVPCGHDAKHNHVLGDARRSPLREIWNSAEYIRFRTAMAQDWRSIEMCRTCMYQPPRRRNLVGNMAFVAFDAFSITEMLFSIGYESGT